MQEWNGRLGMPRQPTQIIIEVVVIDELRNVIVSLIVDDVKSVLDHETLSYTIHNKVCDILWRSYFSTKASKRGGEAGLLIHKHDHFSPARKMRRDVKALAARPHPEWRFQGGVELVRHRRILHLVRTHIYIYIYYT